MDGTFRRLLLIVEGDKEEPRLVEALFKAFNPEATWLVYPYHTVIHDLIQKIVSHYYGDYDNMDIRKVLVDMLPTNDVVKRSMLLDTKFTDVILMFDFDPQDDRMDAKELRKMMASCNDSSDTDRGLLLINYPAVESIKEAAALPYEDFLSSVAHIDSTNSYKAYVNQAISGCPGKFDNFADYNSEPFTRAIAHSVGKIQHLVEGIPVNQTFPFSRGKSLAETCWSIPRLDLLDYQLERFFTSGTVATCGTGHFFIAMWKRSLDGAYKSFYE